MAQSDHKKQAVEREKLRREGSAQSRGRGEGAARDVEPDDVEPTDDLERNPGIGASQGTTMAGADADEVDDLHAQGDNTFPGDVENDAGLPGTGVDPNRRGRGNE